MLLFMAREADQNRRANQYGRGTEQSFTEQSFFPLSFPASVRFYNFCLLFTFNENCYCLFPLALITFKCSATSHTTWLYKQVYLIVYNLSSTDLQIVHGCVGGVGEKGEVSPRTGMDWLDKKKKS